MNLQPVRGTHDLLPEDCERHQRLIEKSRRICLRFGFKEISTPIFEFTSVFDRTLGESSDIVNKEMYTFSDRGGDSITLRPEGTAGIARAFISQGLAQHIPLKLFYHGPMFRYERPQKGRTRQFHQIGVELLGVPSPQADIECIALAWSILSDLNLSSTLQLHLNSIGNTASRQAYREALVKYLKPFEADLSEDSKNRLKTNPMRILDSKSEQDRELIKNAPVFNEFLDSESQTFYTEVRQGLKDLSIPFKEDSLLVRGLDYYSHTVFEYKSTQLGAQDTLLAGGRYDGLVELMGGPSTPGVGWAAGIERLVLLAQLEPEKLRPVAIIPLGEEAEREARRLAHHLRSQGFLVDMAYGGNLSKRMKKANSAGAAAALILGSDELKRGIAMLKILDSGVQTEVKISDLGTALTHHQVSRT